MRVEADVGNRRIVFDPMCLADAQGRPRLGWAYASTIYGSQGLTVDNGVVYVDHSLSRHDIFVASSRARETTTLVVDSRSIDRHLASDLPFDRQHDGLIFSESQRREWLAERLDAAELAPSSPSARYSKDRVRISVASTSVNPGGLVRRRRPRSTVTFSAGLDTSLRFETPHRKTLFKQARSLSRTVLALTDSRRFVLNRRMSSSVIRRASSCLRKAARVSIVP